MPELMSPYQAAKRARVGIHALGLRQLVGHLETFQRDNLFPGKAFRFLEWLEQQGERGKTRTLYPRDVSLSMSSPSAAPC